jgi:2-polyprenyl-3-methyl-5-hydroxy-6-metoxy-1,4-benzoquinol methylase
MNLEELALCPFCGNHDFEIIHSCYLDADRHQGKTEYVQCGNCGLIYLHRRPTPEMMVNYYLSSYKPYVKAIEDETSSFLRFARKYNLNKRSACVIRISNKKQGNILDVGCSTGVFLNGMRAKGWLTCGIETSSFAAQYARDRFDLNIFNEDILNAKIEPDHFDVVTMWDVLEHTFNPLNVLKRTLTLLKEDGVLILRLPNWESLDRKIFSKYWIGYDSPRHLFVFPRSVLMAMLGTAGYRNIRVQRGLGGYFSLVASINLWINSAGVNDHIRNLISAILALPGMSILFSPWFFIADRMKIAGDIIVSAEKQT